MLPLQSSSWSANHTVTDALMPVTATFDFDEREHRQALREAWKLRRFSWVGSAIGVALPAIGLWLGVGRHWRELTSTEVAYEALPWLLLGAFLMTLVPWLRRHQAGRALEHDPSLNGTQLRTVDSAGLHIAGAGYAPSLHWSDLARVTETRHFFLFFEDDRVWHYLPKRALTDVERDSLRNLIQANRRS
jgi:hypothetical protein